MINIEQGEHVLIAGQNGTGKTTLAQRLLSSRSTAIVLDTKHELSWPGFGIVTDPKECFILDKNRRAHTIFRPRNDRIIPYVFKRAYAEGGWDIAVDEVYMLDNESLKDKHSGYLRGLTAGRSRSETVWTLTQRPKFLPLFAMTEAKHIFVFELGFEDDRNYLLKNIGVRGLDEHVEGHEFLYYSRAPGRPRILVRSELQLAS